MVETLFVVTVSPLVKKTCRQAGISSQQAIWPLINSQISNTELKHAEQIIWSFYGSSHGCFQLEVWRLLAES
jgi:hypothetical protein